MNIVMEVQMAIRVRWLDRTQRVLLFDFDPYWTWEDCSGAASRVRSMVSKTFGRFDIIADMRGVHGTYPGGLIHLRNTHRAHSQMYRCYGQMIIVGSVLPTRVLLQMIDRLYPEIGAHYALSDTMEEAFEMISKSRASL